MKTFEPFIYGGFASCLSEAVTFPIDLVKTRLQVQGQQTSTLFFNKHHQVVKPKYSGMANCFSMIVKEEGLRALYGG